MDSLAADSLETQRLLEQVRAGEPEATDQLLDRHRPYLHRLIELRLDPKIRARVDPSDVVQEAQFEASRRLDDYLQQPAMPFRLWLRQIAYDRLLMLRRHHVRAARRAVQRDVPLPDRSSLMLAHVVHDALARSRGASPEYNSSCPAVRKNTIDWVSRPAPGEPSLVAFRSKVATPAD